MENIPYIESLPASTWATKADLQQENKTLRARIAELEQLSERLKQEAQIHAMEARTANATIAEIYQLCSGSTGEAGNWNGAEPVRLRLAEIEKQRDGLVKDAERYRWLRETLESAKGSASVSVNAELAYYEKPELGKEVSIQWYPDTPIGFYLSEASTLDDAIDAALASVQEGGAK